MTTEVGMPSQSVEKRLTDVVGGGHFGDVADYLTSPPAGGLRAEPRDGGHRAVVGERLNAHRPAWVSRSEEVEYQNRHYLVTTRVCEEPTGPELLLIQTWQDITKRKRAAEVLGELPNLATQPPELLAAKLVERVCGIGYRRAYLYLRDPSGEGNPLRCLAAFVDGRLQESLRGEQLPPGDPFVKRAEREKRVIRLHREEVDSLLGEANPASRRQLAGVTGMLKVPLFADGVLIAILCLETVDGCDPFTTEDVVLMELFARGLSDALAASLRIPSSLARARWAWPARAINATLSDGGEVTAVLHEVLRHTAAALNADYAWLLLRDDSSADDALTLRAQWTNGLLSVDTDRLRQFRHPGGVGVTGRALRTRHLQVVPDLWTDTDYLAYYATIRNQPWLEVPSRQLRSTVVMPVFRGAEPVGVVGLFFMEQFQPDPVDDEHLRDVSRLVAVALRRMGDTAAIIAQAAQQAKIADLMLLGSGVAHALRNQLSEVRTSLELAERQLSLPQAVARIREGLAAERRLCERLEQLIEWSKPEGMQPGEVSLADTVDAIRGLIDDRLRSSGVEFVTAFDPATPPVYGPRDAFKMAVLDLFVNAVTALDSVNSGPRRITATLRPCPDSGRAELRITDTGPGVPADQIKVFEQFDTPGGPPPGGIGLGLYLAHRFVTAAGGTIAFHQEPAGGTSVVLTLPVARGGPQ